MKRDNKSTKVDILCMKFPEISSGEFEDKLWDLIKDREIVLEQEDFPYMDSSINIILNLLIDYKKCREDSPAEFYMFDMSLFLKLREKFYGFSIEEARSLFILSLESYFNNTEGVRSIGLNLNKLL